MPPKVNESMQYRENRLETFENGSLQHKTKQKRYWTHSIPDIVQLVDCGFYFTPTKINNDQITCVCCRKKETNVEGVTNIADYHLINNPNCPLALIISSQINHLSNSMKEFWPHQPSKLSDPLSKESIDIRKKTFGKYWKYDKNKEAATTSTTLSRAGFYYCPLRYGNDRVQCVYCNCSLDTWLPDDDPIEEHKKNSNGPCYFLEFLNKEGVNSRSTSRSRSRSNSRLLNESENKFEPPDSHDILSISDAKRIKASQSEEIISGVESENDSNSMKSESNKSPKRIESRKSNLRRKKSTLEDEDYDYNEVDNIPSGDGARTRITRSKVRKLNGGEPDDTDLKISNDISETEGSSNLSIDDANILEINKNERLPGYFSDDKLLANESLSADHSKKESNEADLNMDSPKINNLDTPNISQENMTKNNESINMPKGSEENVNGKGTAKKRRLSSDDGLNNSDSNSYYDSASESAESSTSSNHVKASDISKNSSLEKEKNDSLKESFSSRTRRGKNNLRGQSDNEKLVEFDLTSEEDNNDDSSFREDSNESEDMDNFVSEDIDKHNKRKLRNKVPVNKPKKRTHKELIDNVSFDDERFEQLLKSPKKTKKLRIADSRHTPSPPIYDLSNQNLGDYEEDNIQFLENDIRPLTLRKPILDTKSVKREPSPDFAKSLPRQSEKENDFPNNSRTEKVNKVRRTKETNNNNILNISFGDSENDIFNKHTESFKFDIKNPLSTKSSNEPRKDGNMETAKITERIEDIEPYITKLKDNMPSPVHNILPSNVSVSSDVVLTNQNDDVDSQIDPLNESINGMGELQVTDVKEPRFSPEIKQENKDSRNASDTVKESKRNNNTPESSPKLEGVMLPGDRTRNSVSPISILPMKSTDQIKTDGFRSKESENRQSQIGRSKSQQGTTDDVRPNEVNKRMEDEIAKDHGNSIESENDDGNADINLNSNEGENSDDNENVSSNENANEYKNTNENEYKNTNKNENGSEVAIGNSDENGVDNEEEIEEEIEEENEKENKEEKEGGNEEENEDEMQNEKVNDTTLKNTNNFEKQLVVKSHLVKRQEEKVASERSLNEMQSSMDKRLKSNTEYEEYIRDLKEIDDDYRTSNRFSNPPKISKALDEAAITDINKADSVNTDVVNSRDKESESVSPSIKENSRTEPNIQNNEITRASPQPSRTIVDRFSGNFTNLLESSTLEKKVNISAKPKTSVSSTEPLVWTPTPLSNLLDNLNNMEAASEYLFKSMNSKYDLHDDYDGELTTFISNMPEDEENMTIQEWVRHNAANCNKLARQTCNEMIEFYKAEYLRAIKTLEQLPTSD